MNSSNRHISPESILNRRRRLMHFSLIMLAFLLVFPIIKEVKEINYRVVMYIGFLVSIIFFWWYRENLFNVEYGRLKAEADLESLRADLLAQCERSRKEVDDSSVSDNASDNRGFDKIIRYRYAEINALCDDYYQSRFSKKGMGKMTDEISGIIKHLTEKESIEKIIDYVDEKSNGLYSSFRKDFFDMSEDNLRLFLYLLLGFKARTISVILGQNLSVVYNRKSRLRTKISKSDVAKKNDYLRLL